MRSFVITFEQNGGRVSGKNINPTEYTIISTWRKTVCYLIFLNSVMSIMKLEKQCSFAMYNLNRQDIDANT